MQIREPRNGFPIIKRNNTTAKLPRITGTNLRNGKIGMEIIIRSCKCLTRLKIYPQFLRRETRSPRSKRIPQGGTDADNTNYLVPFRGSRSNFCPQFRNRIKHRYSRHAALLSIPCRALLLIDVQEAHLASAIVESESRAAENPRWRQAASASAR